MHHLQVLFTARNLAGEVHVPFSMVLFLSDSPNVDADDIARTPGLTELDRGSHGILFHFDRATATEDVSAADSPPQSSVVP